MKNPWLGLSVITTAWLAVMVGCSSGSEPGDGDTTTGDTGSPTTTGSSGTTDTTDTTSGTTMGTSTGIELTSGTDDSTTGDTGPDGGNNGGTVPLTPEQIASITSGECEGATSAVKPVPPVIELVVDVSQSMGTVAPGEGPGGATRWDLARPALLAALDTLSDDTAVGLQLFPTSDPEDFGGPGFPLPPATGGASGAGGGPAVGTGGDAGTVSDECVSADGRVPIAPLGPPGSPQRQALADALNDTPLYFGTPTHDAYHNALEEGLKPYTGPGDKFMLLMTDGAPTQLIGCGPLGSGQMAVGLEPIIEEVTATTGAGIRTFVIGSPGSEAGEAGDMRSFLSEVALVGGTGPTGCAVDGPTYCHFDMTAAPDFSAALSQGLADISEQVISTCTFPKPTGEGVDLEDTSVIIQGTSGAVLVLYDGEGDCTEGWVWNAKEEIELCPTTCAALEADPGASVSVSFGCAEVLR